MAYLALIDEAEVEFADEAEVSAALAAGRLDGETWIKPIEAEADWRSVAELFPGLAGT